MRTPLVVACSLVALTACHYGVPSLDIPAGPNATAQVRDASGRELGTVTIVENGGRLLAIGTLRPLPPGTHGVHLHAVGSCVAPAFTSAGGHWNPTAHQHGFDNPMGPHQGDMRNVEVGADSTAVINTSTSGGFLRGTGGALDADGLAIVVHAGPDDYRTDPAGNSGARIACGVVTP